MPFTVDGPEPVALTEEPVVVEPSMEEEVGPATDEGEETPDDDHPQLTRAGRPNFLTSTRFADLNLPPEILSGLEAAGFECCTPIQAQVIPVALEGRDIAGQAQTGTGKTTAFLTPLLTRLLKKPPILIGLPRALIVTPTRELAQQIYQDAKILAGFTDLSLALVMGGVEYKEQAQAIEAGADIVICTPGRILDYIQQGVFDPRAVEIAVVDEADRLLDLGFIKDLKRLLAKLPSYSHRQTMLFSATLDERVLELTYEFMNPPQYITAEPDQATKAQIDQVLYHVGLQEKFSLLLGLLRKEPHRRVLIFCNTKSSVEWLAKKLVLNGFQAEGITGDLPQPKRLRLMEDFKEKRLQIMVATDVASRGIHVEDVSHVYNYDLPQDAENYIHRVGRTARAGKSGKAISFACEDHVFHLEAIENLLGEKIPVTSLDESLFGKDAAGSVKLKDKPTSRRGRFADRPERPDRPDRGERRPDDCRLRGPAKSSRPGGIFGLAPRWPVTEDNPDIRLTLSWTPAEVDNPPAPVAPPAPVVPVVAVKEPVGDQKALTLKDPVKDKKALEPREPKESRRRKRRRGKNRTEDLLGSLKGEDLTGLDFGFTPLDQPFNPELDADLEKVFALAPVVEPDGSLESDETWEWSDAAAAAEEPSAAAEIWFDPATLSSSAYCDGLVETLKESVSLDYPKSPVESLKGGPDLRESLTKSPGRAPKTPPSRKTPPAQPSAKGQALALGPDLRTQKPQKAPGAGLVSPSESSPPPQELAGEETVFSLDMSWGPGGEPLSRWTQAGGQASETKPSPLGAEESSAERQAPERLASEQIVAERLVTEKMATERVGAENLTVEQPVAEQPAPEQPAADQLATGQPAVEQPVAEQPASQQPAADQFATGQPVVEQPATVQLAAVQPVAEAPVAKPPVAKKSSLSSKEPKTPKAPKAPKAPRSSRSKAKGQEPKESPPIPNDQNLGLGSGESGALTEPLLEPKGAEPLGAAAFAEEATVLKSPKSADQALDATPLDESSPLASPVAEAKTPPKPRRTKAPKAPVEKKERAAKTKTKEEGSEAAEALLGDDLSLKAESPAASPGANELKPTPKKTRARKKPQATETVTETAAGTIETSPDPDPLGANP
ncbi:MAG: DEAD/DEAH box helicase [Deltaproteobacteria bacterium]|jgi:ATP-dependent RNA helicase RhlB|nr:DEAD/DEAH box helicase [Deltaproteobacteria bacterium]